METLAWLFTALVAVPAATFCAQCFAGRAALPPAAPSPAPPPFAVLMPAHDEGAGIAATIAAARQQLRPCDRLLVIADNCTDATAAIARASGADVAERHDPAHHSKGHALAFGRAALAADPPAVVIILDADCFPGPHALPRLAAAATIAATQARNLLVTPPGASAAAQISGFAFAVKNIVRQRGLQRLGGQALLRGTGMAFPWPVFAAAPLASADLVEDLELGVHLIAAGFPTRYLDTAHFHSAASSRDATIGQRTRWEHGALSLGWRAAPGLIRAAAHRPRLLLLALDLLVPPLALLAALVAGAILFAVLALLLGASAAPLLAALFVATLLAAGVLAAWAAVGRDHLPLATLLRVPGYILWKLPIYLRLAGNRQRLWVRTSRDG